jgi:hypothetical protein
VRLQSNECRMRPARRMLPSFRPRWISLVADPAIDDADAADRSGFGPQRQRPRQRVLDAQRIGRDRETLLVTDRQTLGDPLSQRDDLAGRAPARRRRSADRDLVDSEAVADLRPEQSRPAEGSDADAASAPSPRWRARSTLPHQQPGQFRCRNGRVGNQHRGERTCPAPDAADRGAPHRRRQAPDCRRGR